MSDKNIFFVALLSCSALVYPFIAQAETLSAKTSWAVSRVASTSQGSYCTMAQKYSDDTVLTIAKNTAEEYSLAIDFKEGQFKGAENQNVTLNSQGATSQKYSVKPKSERALVINIGKEVSLINQIAKTENLSVDIGGKAIQFSLSEFKTGQVEMEGCINGLKSASTNINKLTEDELIKRQVAVVRTPEIEDSQPTAEGLLAAMPMPSADISPSITPQKEAEFIQVKEPVLPVVNNAPNMTPKDNQELLSLREENAKLTRAISEQRQNFENQKSSKETALLSELREKLNMLQGENEALKKDLASTSATPKEDTSKLKADVTALAQSVKTLQDENQSLKLQVAEQKKITGKVETLANQSQRSGQELEALRAENETLKNQIKIAASTKADIVPAANVKELEKIQLENKDLKQEIAKLKEVSKQTPNVQATTVLDDEVIKARNELRQVTSQIDVLKTENNVLKEQVASLQKGSESNQLKAAGGNWDLEQSTRRYQESQREIVRLGALLQAKDAKCTQEKKDIEYMLFDPAIAEKAQIAMLNSLEDQVKEKDEKLRLAETQMVAAEKKVMSEKDQEINQLKKTLIQTKLEYADKLKQANESQDKTIASLKIEIDQKSQQLAKAQAETEKAKFSETDLLTKQQSLDALRAELAQKDQQLTVAQTKIQDIEKANLGIASKDSELNPLKAELAEKSLQLAKAEANTEKAKFSETDLLAKQQSLDALKAGLAQKDQMLLDAQAKIQQASIKVEDNKSAEQAAAITNLQLQVQQANQQILTLQKQIVDSKNMAVQASMATPETFAPKPVYEQQVQATNFKSMDEISSLLKRAGIAVNGPLQNVTSNDSSTYRAYSWKTGGLFGSAEMKKVSDVTQFNEAVDQYLDRAKTRCKGDFAAVPTSLQSTSSKAYEIACVGNSSSSSASVIFSYGDKMVTTIAHEGLAEAMDLVIDARDKVASQF